MVFTLLSLLTTAGAVTFLLLMSQYVRKRSHRLRLPPGPKGKPIIGNLYDMPRGDQQQWIFWLKHKTLYGPVSSVTSMGQTVVIINDLTALQYLMEEKSKVTASRPRMFFARKIIGWGNMSTFQTPGTRLKEYRRALHNVLGSQANLAHFLPAQESEIANFLLRVRDNPDAWASLLYKKTGATVLKLGYGYAIDRSREDPLVSGANEVSKEFSKVTAPGAWLVDMFPFLQHLPEWFPGTEFKRVGREYSRSLHRMAERPFQFVEAQMASGKYPPSYVSKLLEQGVDKDVIQWTAAGLYLGGTVTTASTLMVFLMAMALNYDSQRKAQEEIDRVCPDRMPSFSDREQMPYINAIIKESIRWAPVAPMAFPHTTTEDITYNGYIIPKGTLMMANVWGIMHDPELHEQPFDFNPDRFVDSATSPAELDTSRLVFGFGRRACVGKLVADSAMFLTISQFLKLYNVKKPVRNGHEVDPELKMKPGMVVHPEPFEVCIQPRSPEHMEMLEKHAQQFDLAYSDVELLRRVAP